MIPRRRPARRAERFSARYLRFPLEAAGLRLLVALIGWLPVDAASNFGGFLGRSIGPRLGISKRARRNLALALPEKSPEEIEEIVRGMWDNLGRVVFEYPHLGTIADPASGRVIWEDMAPVATLIGGGRAAVLASAHLANWEIMPVSAAQNDIDMTIIVREPDNVYIQPLVDRLRGVAGGARIPKGKAGFRQAVETLRQGRVLGLLFDQKLNDGIDVEFFGRSAKTTPAPAQLALRLGCPLILVRIDRRGPARFRLRAHALPLGDHKDRRSATQEIMREMNRILEDWIRERPQEWFWLHRRWPTGP